MELISHISSSNGNVINVRLYNGTLKDALLNFKDNTYTLASIRDIVEQRVISQNYTDKSKLVGSWQDNHFLSADSIIYHPDGRVKIVLDLENIGPRHNNSIFLDSNSVLIPEVDFNKVGGFEFTKSQWEKYSNRLFSAYEINQNPIWNALVREDKALLNEYINLVSSIDEDNKEFSTITDKRVLKKMPLYIFPKSNKDFSADGLVQKIIRISSIWENFGGVYTYSENFKEAEKDFYVPVLKKEKTQTEIKSKSNLETALIELVDEGYILAHELNKVKKVLQKYITN